MRLALSLAMIGGAGEPPEPPTPEAPTISASDSLVGRTLTITVNSLTGYPTPSVSLTTLTLDSVDVSGDATGSGPWVYVVPSSAAAQTVAWELTATNTEGSDTASGSEVVAADLFAPFVSASDALVGRTITITVDSLTGTPTPSTSLSLLTLDGSDVSGDATGSGPWSYVVPASYLDSEVLWEVTATNSVDSATSDGEEVVPAGGLPPLAAGGIPDQSWTQDVAITPVDVANDFQGVLDSLTLTSGTLPTGLSFNAGVVSGTPTVTATGTLVFTGTNTYGSDDTGFNFTVSAPADPPEILTADLTGDIVSVTTDQICDLYYWVTANATEDPEDVLANGDFITLTDTDQDITDIDDGLADGTWYIHLVAELDGAYSATTSVEFEVVSAPTTWAAVVGDGDYIYKTGDQSGISGLKTKLLFAANVVRGSGSATLGRLFHLDTVADFTIQVTSTGEVRINAGATGFRVPAGMPTSGAPETILFSIDMAAADIATGVRYYRNGSQITSFTSVSWSSSATINFNSSQVARVSILNSTAVDSSFHGTVGFVYCDFPSSLPDLTDSAVRALFEPGGIESDGSGPTSAQPLLYVTGPATAWNAGTNHGYGGTPYTVSGTFVDA